MPRKIVILLVFLISYSSIKAQSTYEEIGIMAGPVFFQSDFGAKGDFENAISNVGVSAGVFYYISLNKNRSSFADNFKVRFEASFMRVDLKHHGKYVEADTDFARKLRGMKSAVKAGNVGVQLEFYPFKTDDFSQAIFSPYVSVGGQLTSYSVKAYSMLGNIGTPITTPVKYLDGFKSDSGLVASATASIGFRFKLSDYHALSLDARLQYYFSDWIDGMNPNREIYTENTTNDYSATLNLGYIYYFH